MKGEDVRVGEGAQMGGEGRAVKGEGVRVGEGALTGGRGRATDRSLNLSHLAPPLREAALRWSGGSCSPQGRVHRAA